MRDKIGRAILYGFGYAAIAAGILGLTRVLALGAPASSLLVTIGVLGNGIILVRGIRDIPPGR
jgi:hypothetical protein